MNYDRRGPASGFPHGSWPAHGPVRTDLAGRDACLK
jgi:hypothetical protein